MADGASPLVLRAYGRTVGIDAPSDLLAEVRRRLPLSYRPSDDPAEQTWSITDPDHELGAIELWVAEHARSGVFIHAGCAVIDGRAILLPGRTMTGKSTLTAALVAAGATYFSDEYAVLDSAGQVRPYARPISLRPSDAGSPQRIDVTTVGGTVGRGPAAVGLVLTVKYDETSGWSVAPVAQSQAVMSLIDNAVAARSRPRAVLTATDRVATNAQSYAGTRGDAAEAAARIMAMMTKS